MKNATSFVSNRMEKIAKLIYNIDNPSFGWRVDISNGEQANCYSIIASNFIVSNDKPYNSNLNGIIALLDKMIKQAEESLTKEKDKTRIKQIKQGIKLIKELDKWIMSSK